MAIRVHKLRWTAGIKWCGVGAALALIVVWIDSHRTERFVMHFGSATTEMVGYSRGILGAGRTDTVPIAAPPFGPHSAWNLIARRVRADLPIPTSEYAYPRWTSGGSMMWRFTIPMWIPTAAAIGVAAIAWRADRRARGRLKAALGLCPHCGYSREGLIGSDSPCPECGHEQSAPTVR